MLRDLCLQTQSVSQTHVVDLNVCVTLTFVYKAKNVQTQLRTTHTLRSRWTSVDVNKHVTLMWMRLAIFFQVHTSTDARVRNVIKPKWNKTKRKKTKKNSSNNNTQQKGLEYILGLSLHSFALFRTSNTHSSMLFADKFVLFMLESCNFSLLIEINWND